MTKTSLHIMVPERVFKEIERRRKTPAGDVSRSKYVSNILERVFFDQVDKSQNRLEVQ